jgi:hypothetical protein
LAAIVGVRKKLQSRLKEDLSPQAMPGSFEDDVCGNEE